MQLKIHTLYNPSPLRAKLSGYTPGQRLDCINVDTIENAPIYKDRDVLDRQFRKLCKVIFRQFNIGGRQGDRRSMCIGDGVLFIYGFRMNLFALYSLNPTGWTRHQRLYIPDDSLPSGPEGHYERESDLEAFGDYYDNEALRIAHFIPCTRVWDDNEARS